MIRQATTEVRLVTKALHGHANASADAPSPYLVLDLGRGRDPHQARCRRCRWRSGWRATAPQVWAEHDRHQLTAHGRGRRSARRGGQGLVARWTR
jgi:hypothetical protein